MRAVDSIRRVQVFAPTLAVALLALALSGCVHHYHHPGSHSSNHPSAHSSSSHSGPPPWAPAHGHRHKQHGGAELVFDSGLGVYLVVGHTDLYFHRDHYYRYLEGRWELSIELGGPWLVAKVDKIPPGLIKHKSKQQKSKKHHKKHPGKHRGHGHPLPASLD
jgi:hypothetical protein